MLTEQELKNREKLKAEKPLVLEKVLKYPEKTARHESTAMIQIQYDYLCPFHCSHCSVKKYRARAGKERALTVKDVASISKQADELGHGHVLLSGGEPLAFPDYNDVIAAINPELFYIVLNTNGWYLDEKMAKHSKEIGVDRMDISIDSGIESEHDAFRNKPGSWKKAIDAVWFSKAAGLDTVISTVVTKQRLYSKEFMDFLDYSTNVLKVMNFVGFGKPVGEWEGRTDILINDDDLAYFRKLESKFLTCTHLTPRYGEDTGCIAVKKWISITKYGEVLPCTFMHKPIGNYFEEPLKEILERGMRMPQFKNKVNTCVMATTGSI